MKRVATFGLAMLSFAASARAHHGTSVSQVGAQASRPGSSIELVPPPRVDLGLTYETLYFGRVREGSRDYEKGHPGSVHVNTLTPSARLVIASRTSFSLSIPVGLVTTKPAEGVGNTGAGLGDTQLSIAQDLAPLLGSRDRAFELSVRVSATLPTGRYEPESNLSVVDIAPGDAGALNLMTYNTRASLGASTFALSAGVDVAAQLQTRVRVRAGAGVSRPITRTRDDILWGTDVYGEAGVQVGLVRDVVGVEAGADYRLHDRDTVRAIDESRGEYVDARVGGRHEVAVSAGLSLRVAPTVACSVRARVPVYQYAGGVQLVETVSANAGCAVSLGL